jgi:hypothetical protein
MSNRWGPVHAVVGEPWSRTQVQGPNRKSGGNGLAGPKRVGQKTPPPSRYALDFLECADPALRTNSQARLNLPSYSLRCCVPAW